MTDIEIALTIVALIVAFGCVVSWCDRRDPNVLEQTTERRQMAIKRETTGRRL